MQRHGGWPHGDLSDAGATGERDRYGEVRSPTENLKEAARARFACLWSPAPLSVAISGNCTRPLHRRPVHKVCHHRSSTRLRLRTEVAPSCRCRPRGHYPGAGGPPSFFTLAADRRAGCRLSHPPPSVVSPPPALTENNSAPSGPFPPPPGV